jgi:hypothetical protein
MFSPYNQDAGLGKGLSYWKRVGLETDIWINVLTGGKPGQTVSLRTAEADGWRYDEASKGPVRYVTKVKWWGCVGCRVLNWVQNDHCERQFEQEPTPGLVYVRAAIAFLLAGLLVASPILIYLLVSS